MSAGADGGAMDYRGAGVDIEAAEDSKQRIRRHVESTFTRGTLGAFGGFGGMIKLPPGLRSPVLVSSADGVGTKIRVAAETGRNDTVGHDLVNHCCNDILVQGALPLFFLDYVAFGVLEPAVVEAVVAGVAAGCRENGCSLLGGETAEMPGLYTPPDYDLAGFIVGYVEEDAVLGAERVRAGDVLVGLESSGLHTNGYSLARRIVAERLRLRPADPFRARRVPPPTSSSACIAPTSRHSGRCSGACTRWRTSRVAGCRGTSTAPCPRRWTPSSIPRAGRSRTPSASCRRRAASRPLRCSAPSTWASGWS
jgi:hypothetical protein